MALKIKHVSESVFKAANKNGYDQTLYGSKAEVDAYMDSVLPGNIEESPGYYVDTIRSKPTAGGDIWEVDISFAQDVNDFGQISTQSNNPNTSSLSTKMISISLESLTAAAWVSYGYDYRTNWNYALASAPGISASPAWWITATDLIIPEADIEKYVWLSNENDVATLPKKNGQSWALSAAKTKPGVDAIYFPVYEIQESAKHKNKTQASWISRNKAGKIAVPTLGTFGITSGNWLCMGGNVEFDGKNWIATCTYQHSPSGWDVELYPN